MSCTSCQTNPCACSEVKVPIGDEGTPGSQIYCGSGVPPNLLGIDGDYYLDIDTDNLYQKINGTWGIKTNLKGAIGAPGIDGNDGNQGAQGDPGVAGSAGSNGSNGTNGDDGLGYNALTTTSAHTVPGIFPSIEAFTGIIPTTFAYTVGARARAADPSDPIGTWMEGPVTAVGAGSITISVDNSNGAGNSSSSWDINIAGEVGSLGSPGSLNISTSQVTTLDPKCLGAFANNQLDTAMQAIIDQLCNLSTVTLGPAEKDYLFKAKKFDDQIIGATGVTSEVLFENDNTVGSIFDYGGTWSGTNWEDDAAHATPNGLKFVLSGLSLTNDAAAGGARSATIAIAKNGSNLVTLVTPAIAIGATFVMGILETAFESLIAGDDIRVTVTPGGATVNGELKVNSGGLFFNIDES